jgi:leucyl-tRNA synthetase
MLTASSVWCNLIGRTEYNIIHAYTLIVLQMSKQTGNFLTLSDAVAKYSADG